MNQVLNRLEDLGAISRPQAAGRTLPAQLTPAGRDLLKRAQSAILVADDELLTSISRSELRQLKSILFKAGHRAEDPEV
jgi:DNA-binding MarR family transcriptional regulator